MEEVKLKRAETHDQNIICLSCATEGTVTLFAGEHASCMTCGSSKVIDPLQKSDPIHEHHVFCNLQVARASCQNCDDLWLRYPYKNASEAGQWVRKLREQMEKSDATRVQTTQD